MNFHITHTKSHSYILAIALLSLIFLFTLNTSHALSFPAGITNYVALNISNSQSTATPNPFQQMINITSSDNGWTYINTNQTTAFGENVEFFYSNGTIIPSWPREGPSLFSRGRAAGGRGTPRVSCHHGGARH